MSLHSHMQAWLQRRDHPAWTCCHSGGQKPASLHCSVVLQAALQATQQATDGPRRKTDPNSSTENGTSSSLLLPKYCEAIYKSLRRPTRTINVSSMCHWHSQGRCCGSCHPASSSRLWWLCCSWPTPPSWLCGSWHAARFLCWCVVARH